MHVAAAHTPNMLLLCDLPHDLLARIFCEDHLFHHGHVLNKQLRQVMHEHTRLFPRPITYKRALFAFESLALRGLYNELAMCSLLQDSRLCIAPGHNEDSIYEAVESWMERNEGAGQELLKLIRYDLLPKRCPSAVVRERGPPIVVAKDDDDDYFVLCMHHRSPHVFCGLRCGRILVCDEQTLQVIKTIEGDGGVACMTSYVVAMSNFTGLITGHQSPYNYLCIWDIVVDEAADILVPRSTYASASWYAHGTRCCEVSPCQQYLVTTSEDKTINVWQISHTTNLFELQGTIDASSVVHSLVITSEGHIISGREDGNITVYHLHTQKRVWTVRVHAQKVSALAVVGNKTLVSASADGTVVACELGGCWRFVSRYRVPHTFGRCTSLAVANGGNELLCGCYDGFVVALDAPTLRWRYNMRAAYYMLDILHVPSLGTLGRYIYGAVVHLLD